MFLKKRVLDFQVGYDIWNGKENFKSKKPRRKRIFLRIVEGKGGWESGGQCRVHNSIC